MWETLAPHARLFGVDLPGFGRSESHDHLLAPRAMGDFLARLVAEADLGRPYVVGPDVGTAAALFAAADHPNLFSGLVVGGGGTAHPLKLGEPLASWVLDPDLDRQGLIDQLSSQYGDQYTVAQATYAANKVGLSPDRTNRAADIAPSSPSRFGGAGCLRHPRNHPGRLPRRRHDLTHKRAGTNVVSHFRHFRARRGPTCCRSLRGRRIPRRTPSR